MVRQRKLLHYLCNVILANSLRRKVIWSFLVSFGAMNGWKLKSSPMAIIFKLGSMVNGKASFLKALISFEFKIECDIYSFIGRKPLNGLSNVLFCSRWCAGMGFTFVARFQWLSEVAIVVDSIIRNKKHSFIIQIPSNIKTHQHHTVCEWFEHKLCSEKELRSIEVHRWAIIQICCFTFIRSILKTIRNFETTYVSYLQATE